ncbi:class I SAM-dependent methyltransferase [Shimia abyssi]|uniref:16S rRNA (Guanine1207-N2)-methyltransferase n=1 Tax=Shimia abyssi TaxID=1662395 RepID=A0A2P8FKI3_9RHOB|nr:class I SAM-dependent methyltransferase [Shimia abyssi]PSL22237.1 16S rRNA (guanine1207-N2)-methyltransferase [Shimia abyssi]
MSHSRLTLAADEHGLPVSGDGRIAVFGPRAEYDLSALPKDRCQIIQPLKPDHEAFAQSGYTCDVAAEGPFAMAVVVLPRAKAQARDMLAQAAQMAELVVVDGQKTDGIDSILKACRKEAEVETVVSKAHGKLFWFRDADLSDWRAPAATTLDSGFITKAGVFSADGIDPASEALADALPKKLGRVVADLGAGWGYLSANILAREGVDELHLVEADHVALECARRNVADSRAQFHWADATNWVLKTPINTVVMNPPFHTGRKAEPGLGIAFIQTAARVLTPSGHLWMVANRHLPYETTLEACFAKVEEVAGDNRFKVLHAQRPSRKRR